MITKTSRKLIIFGNGLGMAIDPQHFNLKRALNEVWDNDSYLSFIDKKFLKKCLKNKNVPHGEDDLDIFHIANIYCKFLSNLDHKNNKDTNFLSSKGEKFPLIASKFIHNVAFALYGKDKENIRLPSTFEDSLVDFISNTKSHVATLNYDKLLYESFLEKGILQPTYNNTSLVDGILRDGFDASNLERHYGNDFGYYLHLHGSPLFYNKDKKIVKFKRNELHPNCVSSEHIVLTHVKHKREIITRSNLLYNYWEYLKIAISEADEVVLFGYSGMDIHLNEILKMYLNYKKNENKNKNVKIIEWKNSVHKIWDGHNFEDHEGSSQEFWDEIIGKKVSLIQLSNITDYTDW